MTEYVVIDKVQLERDLTAIAGRIRAKAGATEKLTFPEGFKSTVDGIETGDEARAEIETLIDESGVLDSTEGTVEEKVEQVIKRAEEGILLYDGLGAKKTYASFLRDSDINKFPRLNFENCTSVQYFCSGCQNLESIDYYINCPLCTDFHCAFDGCRSLKIIYGIDTSSATRMTYTFRNCSALETIQEPLNFSKATETAQTFNNCYELTDIKFISETIHVSISFVHSSKLTAESIQSIIDGLAYVETAQTLTLPADIVLTDEQKSTINSKGWTLVQ